MVDSQTTCNLLMTSEALQSLSKTERVSECYMREQLVTF